MQSAYEHFCKTPGVKIVEIKSLSKMKELSNCTVLFIFENMFIGEMQMKFKANRPWYDANHFLYEITRSQMKIELLQTINKRQITHADLGDKFYDQIEKRN